METVIEWLREARGEIIAGLVLALLGWLYSRYRAFMRMYRLKKQELERIESELFNFGNTKLEIERLQEALRESEAQRQELQSQIDVLRQEFESVQAELRHKEEDIRLAETQKSEEAECRAEIERQLEAQRQEQVCITPEKTSMIDQAFLKTMQTTKNFLGR